MFAVNVRAPFFLMQEAANIMRREKIEGTMVNILSMSAHGGQPFISAYCGSKGALATLTKNAAFGAHALSNPRERPEYRLDEHARRGSHHADLSRCTGRLAREGRKAQPFGRLLDPHEVARAVAFLAGRESGLMTGSIIDFDQSVLGCYEDAPHPSKPAV